MTDTRLAPGTYVKSNLDQDGEKEGIVIGFDGADSTYLIVRPQVEEEEPFSGNQGGWAYGWGGEAETHVNPKPTIKFPGASDDPEHVFLVRHSDPTQGSLRVYANADRLLEDLEVYDNPDNKAKAAIMRAVSDPGEQIELDADLSIVFMPVLGAER